MMDGASVEVLSTEFDLPFRGARNYLQGTDLFTAVSAWVIELTAEPQPFLSRITFNHRTDKVASAVLGGQEAPAGAFGTFTLDPHCSLASQTGWLVETGKPVERRVEYDEPTLIAGAEFDADNSNGRLHIPGDFSTIQAVVALTKLLCNRVAPGGGAWLFARLDLAAPMEPQAEVVEVRLKRLIDQRYAVLEVLQNGETIGMMRFIKDTDA